MGIDTVSWRIEIFNLEIKEGVALATPSCFTQEYAKRASNPMLAVKRSSR